MQITLEGVRQAAEKHNLPVILIVHGDMPEGVGLQQYAKEWGHEVVERASSPVSQTQH